MDAIDMKTFGLMAAIGKIELDNFRERATMGKRGAAKQGRISTGRPPYGYRVDSTGRPEVDEAQAAVVHRMFREYVHEGIGTARIAWQLTGEGVPPAGRGKRWHKAHINRMLSNTAYKGVWIYGQTRAILTEDGTRRFNQPRENWIEVPMPALVDEETWDRAQTMKQVRLSTAKRNTKELYLLQHLLRCAECGRKFGSHAIRVTTTSVNGMRFSVRRRTPRKYYYCHGKELRLRCREYTYIREEKLEERVWGQVKGIFAEPSIIVAGIEAVGDHGSESVEENIAKTERELRDVQSEEDRLIRLYVASKITERLLDLQRKFITERLESLRDKLNDYRARMTTAAERHSLAESVLAWIESIGEGLENMNPLQRRDLLRRVVDEIVVDRANNLEITLAVPIGQPVDIATHASVSK